MTFRDFAESWRRIQLHRDGTAQSVEHQLRLHVYPHIGHRPIASVRPSELQALAHRLADTLSPSTVQVVFGRVRAVFGAAIRDCLISTSPCLSVRLPSKAPGSLLQVLTTEEVLAVADAVLDRYRALVIFGAGTGLRPGELFGLTQDRVRFLERNVVVDQQLVRTDGGVRLGPLKTRSSYRTVPLPKVAGDHLAAHLARWRPHAELGVVFTNERGGPIQQHPFSVVWGNARRWPGVPEWATPHDLRRTSRVH